MMPQNRCATFWKLGLKNLASLHKKIHKRKYFTSVHNCVSNNNEGRKIPFHIFIKYYKKMEQINCTATSVNVGQVLSTSNHPPFLMVVTFSYNFDVGMA